VELEFTNIIDTLHRVLECFHSFTASHTIFLETVTRFSRSEANSYPLSINVLNENIITFLVQVSIWSSNFLVRNSRYNASVILLLSDISSLKTPATHNILRCPFFTAVGWWYRLVDREHLGCSEDAKWDICGHLRLADHWRVKYRCRCRCMHRVVVGVLLEKVCVAAEYGIVSFNCFPHLTWQHPLDLRVNVAGLNRTTTLLNRLVLWTLRKYSLSHFSYSST